MVSIWESEQFRAQPDLVVIGGGIVGLFTALLYKREHPGQLVMVLERGAHPSGASVKNAGFACFGSPSELLADLDKEGEEAMLARVEERWKGLLELRSELGDAAIGFEPTGGHEIYPSHTHGYTAVADRFNALNDSLRPIFGEAVFAWDDAAISRFGLANVGHLVRTRLEGPLDSGRLMAALLRRTLAEGVLFRPLTEVASIEPSPGHVSVRTKDGQGIRAAMVAICTNGYTGQLLPELPVEPARGQVLKTSPIPGLRLRGTFHYGEGFYYFRDHAGGVLLGGGRDLDITGERTTEDGTTPLIQETLEALLRTVILPGQPFKIERRWSGIMGMGPSKSPIVERLSERVVVAVRLGGMGVAIGIRVARRAVALLRQ
ncbi:MAG TPA: FAD-dependent oxidoreductase [Flavobacteriales bacterium]|nr:FAD-dependent oxidoreductase [Flavobacteriales bacterium]